jgi:hypothetical protein
MDPITSRALSQRDVNHINNCVWETTKHIGVSLEAKNNDFDNNMFYTPPSYPLEPFLCRIGSSHGCRSWQEASCILLDYHLKICDQVLYLPFRCCPFDACGCL